MVQDVRLAIDGTIQVEHFGGIFLEISLDKNTLN